MKGLPTGSAASRASRCGASWVLPWIKDESPASKRGDSVHFFIEQVGLVGKQQALKKVPREHHDYCASLDLEGLPLDVPGAMSEATFGYDVETGEAVLMGHGFQRCYPEMGPRVIVLTIDHLVYSPERVQVWDWKTGSHPDYTPPLEENLQLQLAALTAARKAGLGTAEINLVHFDEIGRRTEECRVLEVNDLAKVAMTLLVMARRVEEAREEVEAGCAPNVTVGPHCSFCPALLHCPAFGGLIKRMLRAAGLEHLDQEARAMLTPQQAHAAYRLWRQMKTVVDGINRAVYGYAGRYPIDLDNGMMLGEVTSRKEEFAPLVVAQVLEERHGLQVALKASRTEVSVTRALVKEALATVAQKGELAGMERAAWVEIEKRGGIAKCEARTIKEYRARQPGEDDGDE